MLNPVLRVWKSHSFATLEQFLSKITLSIHTSSFCSKNMTGQKASSEHVTIVRRELPATIEGDKAGPKIYTKKGDKGKIKIPGNAL
jgi:hypothetical protein